MYLVFCSMVIFIAQLISINSIFIEALQTDVMCEDQGSSYAILLCILYAAAAAVEDVFVCIPFEIVGLSKKEYCEIVTRNCEHGLSSRCVYWSKTILRLWAPGTPEEKFSHIYDFYELLSAIVPAVFLIGNNIYLVVTIGTIMAISGDTLTLVQNFISVELLVHVHEIIPRIVRLKDRSPHRLNKNWRLVIHYYHI